MKRLLVCLLLIGVVGCGRDEETDAQVKQDAAQVAILQKATLTNSVGMEFKKLPAGSFLMGSDSGETDEKPVHQVTLTKPFEIGVYEVTQEQYERVTGTNPFKIKGRTLPVVGVNWDAAQRFCEKLSNLPAEKAAGCRYRLPTEAEWEYACRAGTTTEYSFGDDESKLGDYAWYDGNSDAKTHPVGEKEPNSFGLYDMHGNVWERCQDKYGPYPSGKVIDPTGATTTKTRPFWRVFRGGAWYLSASSARSACRVRNSTDPRSGYDGFRLVRVRELD